MQSAMPMTAILSEAALQRLQFQVQKVQKWLTSSGLNVNVEKTEIVIFHKTDTTTSSIKINEIEIQTKKQMSVLEVMFDSKLEWSLQVENSVRKARKKRIAGPKNIKQVLYHTREIGFDNFLFLLAYLLQITSIADTFSQKILKE
jgi:hypothetical protein